MYQTRTERFHAEQKRNRLKWRWPALLLTALLIVSLGFAVMMMNLYSQKRTNPISKQPEQTVQSKASTEEEPFVNLTFVGDVMMDGHVATTLKEKGYEFPYTYVRSMLQQDDFTIANLETPVTALGTPANDKEYVYKSSPEAIPALKEAGIDLVNLANNHSMDQGEDGLLDTFRVLNENKIEYVGAGADDKRAYAPVIIERNGIKIAFFGFSRVIPEVNWYAGKNKPGVAATYDPARAAEAIRAAKADLVIVIAHWGKERVDEPVDYQKSLSAAYIEAGADLVIGGHPHVLQGFESYNGKWIAYSLGNFIFTRSGHPKTWETMVLQAKCSKKGVCELKMMPYYAELGQAVPMDQKDGAKLFERIESISNNVRIESDGSILETTKSRSP